MIQIFQSHSLQTLANAFISQDFDTDEESVLEPIWVIVQNNEIKEWLSLKWAQEKGISGNLKFIFPSEFLWILFRLVRDDIPKNLPSDLNAMQWCLYDILKNEPQLLDHMPFSKKEEQTDSYLFHLSSQIADIFDQYQVYRPQMMNSWIDRKMVTKSADEGWQSILWRKLNEYWRAYNDTGTIPTRSEAYGQLLKWIKDEDQSILQSLPDRVHVFGLSHVSEPFLNILEAIGSKKEVTYFARKIDTEEVTGEMNELIEDWSSAFNEQQKLLLSLCEKAGTEVSINEIKEAKTDLPQISINSCHSARREVEVLKDSILHYLKDHPEVSPHEILVLVPDPEEYFSLIRSIFTSTEPALPISRIYNNDRVEEHTLVELLDLLKSSFKPGKVIELLSLRPVRNTFSFSDDEVDLLEEWISKNHIYRGKGDSFNTLHSWRKGINQLIAGLAMKPDPLSLYNRLIPFEGIYSSDDMQLSARFSLFLNGLLSASEKVQESKSPQQWIKFCEDLVKVFIQDEYDQNHTASIFQKLSRLKEQVGYSIGVNEVSYEIISGWVKTQFENAQSASGRFGQGITISSYVPYRSVPFRCIAFLGMNESVFPRKAVRPDFDLIYADPQPGDRIQKDDDRYLFLETLFAAKDQLVISYRGQDQKNDSERLPSSLVQELREALPESAIQFYKHSLHAFSEIYFKEDLLPESFSNVNLQIAKNLYKSDQTAREFLSKTFLQPDLKDIDRVSVHDFIKFFYEPSKYMVQNYLQISDRLYLSEVEDREPFEVDGLKSYKLSAFLLQHMDEEVSGEQMLDYARSSALVPDKLKGEKIFEEHYQIVKELKQEVGRLTEADEVEANISLMIDDVELYGTLPGVHGKCLVTSRIGKRKPVNEIELWLKHLILVEAGLPISKSIFVSREKSEIEIFEIPTSPKMKGVLKTYMQWFLSEKPIIEKAAFFPSTSKKYAETYLKEGDAEAAVLKSRSEWEPGYNRSFVESSDYYNQLLYKRLDVLTESYFRENALMFWEPFIEVLEEGRSEN